MLSMRRSRSDIGVELEKVHMGKVDVQIINNLFDSWSLLLCLHNNR